MRRLSALLLVLFPLACAESSSAKDATSATSSGGGRPKLAMVPKGTTHVFWKTVEEGARRAADELDVELLWKGALDESDRAQQIQLVQQFVTQGVDGLILAPLDHKALAGAVRQATSSGVPVVIFDSGLEGEPGRDFTSFVATDNLYGGKLGGEHLAGLLGGEGKVVLLRYLVGSASTDERERGFLDAVGAAGLEVLVENRYAGATTGEAKTAALNLLDSLRQADGIFCPNESATLGMLLALRQEGLAGKVRFVGFDASPPLVEGLRAGEIDALVLQDPRKMGELAVRAMADHLNGRPVEPVVDTGVVVATRENMDDPAVAPLLK